LCGIVTADHGETFPGIYNERHQVLSTFSGVHGFRLDADSIHVPLHPFGNTTWNFHTGDLYSWLDLRDNIHAWLNNEGPLNLESSQDGRVIQIPTIRAVHLETPAKQASSFGGAVRSEPFGNQTPLSQGKAGIHPKDILRAITFLPNGLWFAHDMPEDYRKQQLLSSALIRGNRMVIYNPEEDGTYSREDWDGYHLTGAWKTERAQVEREVLAFEKSHLLPPPPKE
jgi:hypothetical protein